MPARKRPLLIFFFVLCLSLGESAHALSKRAPARPCETTLQPIDPDIYVRALTSRTDYSRSIVLPTLKTGEQGAYGCCWIHAPVGRWERMLAARLKLNHPPKLSVDYLIFASLMYRIEEGIFTGAEISQGGWAAVAEWMALNIGTMPESAWTPKIRLQSDEGVKLVAWLNERVAEIHREIPNVRTQNLSDDEVWKFFEAKKLELMREFKARVGVPPGKFSFRGKRYSPHSFSGMIAPKAERGSFLQFFPNEKRFRSPFKPANKGGARETLFGSFPELRERFAVNAIKRQKGLPEADPSLSALYSRATVGFVHTKNRDLAEIHAAVIDSLNAGRAVHVSIPMVKGFYSDAAGILSLAAYGKTAKDIDPATVIGGHGMLITGFLVDREGALIGYRIQNSWGDKAGELGYYTMDLDYFEAFVDSVTIAR